MAREGVTDLTIAEDGFQNVTRDHDFEAENQSSVNVAEESRLLTGQDSEACHVQQRHPIEGQQHRSVDDLVESSRVEQDQSSEPQQTNTLVNEEQQSRWGSNDWQEDSWNVEANEPSGWDLPTETALPNENFGCPSTSSSGWGLLLGESEPAPFVDLGYFDEEIVILGSSLVVRVAYTAKGVEDWIEKYSPEERRFGVDIEWRPNHFKGEDNKAALFQIAGKHGCLIVQLLYIDRVPDALNDLLADPNAKLAGVGVKADSKKLFHDYGLQCCGEVELGLLAAAVLNRSDLKRAGLATLCELVLGIPFKKIKSVTVSDWAVKGLSLSQITYAASDACIAYSLLVALNEQSKERLSARSPLSSSPLEK